MKNLSILAAIMLLLAGVISCQTNTKEIEPNTKETEPCENHEISTCGINDPLQNIEWLKNYCENVQEKQTFSEVSVDLYKITDKDEHLFFVNYSTENDFSISHYLKCMNCNNDTVFHFAWMVGKGDFYPMHPDLQPYDDFMKDKEHVAELFHFVRQ